MGPLMTLLIGWIITIPMGIVWTVIKCVGWREWRRVDWDDVKFIWFAAVFAPVICVGVRGMFGGSS